MRSISTINVESQWDDILYEVCLHLTEKAVSSDDASPNEFSLDHVPAEYGISAEFQYIHRHITDNVYYLVNDSKAIKLLAFIFSFRHFWLRLSAKKNLSVLERMHHKNMLHVYGPCDPKSSHTFINYILVTQCLGHNLIKNYLGCCSLAVTTKHS